MPALLDGAGLAAIATKMEVGNRKAAALPQKSDPGPALYSVFKSV